MVFVLCELSSPRSLGLLKQALRDHELLVFPTETVLGLGCAALDQEAVQKLEALKGGSARQGWLMVIDSYTALRPWVKPDLYKLFPIFEKLTRSPLSLVWPSDQPACSWLNPQNKGTLAFRITQNPFLLKLLSQMNGPLIATSANLAGEKPPNNWQNLPEKLIHKVSIIFNLGFPALSGQPSTLALVRPPKALQILRVGDYSVNALRQDLPIDWVVTP